MEQSLSAFRRVFRESLAQFLWRSWSALGVAGHERGTFRGALDPEALLAFTCSAGRMDARLFDEMLDWLAVNGGFINVQRLRNVMRSFQFRGGPVLSAVAAWLAGKGKNLKWKQLADSWPAVTPPESLFLLEDERPLPVVSECDPVFQRHGFLRNSIARRGLSQPFHPSEPACLILRLRALFGVSARCEIMHYLLTHPTAHAHAIARETCYFQKTIHDTLNELACSGMLVSVRNGRQRSYRFRDNALPEALIGRNEQAEWLHWPTLLAAAEQVWCKTGEIEQANLEPVLEASEIAFLLEPIHRQFLEANWLSQRRLFDPRDGISALWGFASLFDEVTRQD